MTDSAPSPTNRGLDIWTLAPSVPRVAARRAQEAEADGFDGIMLADSQNLAAELVVELAVCAATTERIAVAPGVANCVTRHPAVLAGAMATLQAEFGGRAELAIGRGDSALAHIGCAPASVGHFAAYLRALQGYLRGEDVDFDRRFVPDGVSPVDALGLGTAPPASRLQWLRPDAAKVPVHVAATGPKVIDLAATVGDGVAFAVGADPERIGWAVARAKQARQDAGLDPDGLELAAWLNIAVHPDPAVARNLVGGGLASFSRFSVIHGRPAGGAPVADAAVLAELHRSYDMTEHGNRAVSHTTVLTEDFTERNAVIGDPQRCIERLRELAELGITRFLLMEAFSRDGDAGVAHRNLVRDVLPELRA